MNRSGLKFLASLLVTAMAVLPFAGLDNLPRDLRRRIDAERATLSSSLRQEQSAKSEVNADLAADPALFKTIASASAWPGQFADSESKLSDARSKMVELGRLEKADRRQDRDRAESLLVEAQGLRASAAAEAQTTQTDAARWVELKRQLPDELRRMEQDYTAIHALTWIRALKPSATPSPAPSGPGNRKPPTGAPRLLRIGLTCSSLPWSPPPIP
jgi:hypothetical protein